MQISAGSPASATCYSGTGHWYVAGGNGNNNVISVRTDIEWLNPDDLCSSSTSYSVSIVNGSGWLQVGWLDRSGYSAAMGYCEINPQANGLGSYSLTEYSVTHQKQGWALLATDRARPLLSQSMTSKRMPAAWSRASSASPIAWAVVTWPAVSGLSSRARHRADSASIFAVSL